MILFHGFLRYALCRPIIQNSTIFIQEMIGWKKGEQMIGGVRMLPTNVIWKPTTGVGYEHLRIREGSNRIHVNSVVIGRLDDATLTRIQYEMVLDSNWVTREVSLAIMGEEGPLHLSSDGKGNWTNEVGSPFLSFLAVSISIFLVHLSRIHCRSGVCRILHGNHSLFRLSISQPMS